jgi:hypothetical protein
MYTDTEPTLLSTILSHIPSTCQQQYNYRITYKYDAQPVITLTQLPEEGNIVKGSFPRVLHPRDRSIPTYLSPTVLSSLSIQHEITSWPITKRHSTTIVPEIRTTRDMVRRVHHPQFSFHPLRPSSNERRHQSRAREHMSKVIMPVSQHRDLMYRKSFLFVYISQRDPALPSMEPNPCD